jgi:tripartite-type tricarboxylate transporter receptor subunit TctC
MLLAHLPANAQGVADFYRGKTVTLTVGYSAGGGYDTYARILARHMGKHIPGSPAIVVQNLPGAGSLKAANLIYNVAPKDGTAFGMFGRGIALEPLIGSSNSAQFDAIKFLWLGSGTDEAAVVVIWHAKRIASWADMLAKPFTVGGEGTGSDPDVYALMLKNVFGVKLRLVTGYPGTAEMALALERGEVDGRASWSWSSLKSYKPDWIAQNKITLPVQLNLTKSPDLPNVPLIFDYAANERQRQILKLVLSRQTMGRPFMGPPGIPADRAAALRKAFADTMKDAEFLAEAKARGQEVNPVSGGDLDKLLAELYATPKGVVAETKTAISTQ